MVFLVCGIEYDIIHEDKVRSKRCIRNPKGEKTYFKTLWGPSRQLTNDVCVIRIAL